MATDILFFFDTEDFTTERNADAILGLANMLTEEGVKGHFGLVGLLAKQLLNWKRQDVVNALQYHIIGTHTYSHSIHPDISEMSEDADYEAAHERVMASEKAALDLIHETMGNCPVMFAVPPGDSVSYVALHCYQELGIPFYCGGYIHDNVNSLVDYGSMIQIPYWQCLEGLFMREPPQDVDALLDRLSTCRRIILYHHPNMSVKKIFWDVLNYKGGNLREFGDWIQAEDLPLGNTIMFWHRFRMLIRRLQADERFNITDLHAIKKQYDALKRTPLTRSNFAAVMEVLSQRLDSVPDGPYCVADVFHAALDFLHGKESYVPKTAVKGFLQTPVGISRPTKVQRTDILAAANTLQHDGFIPEAITVGSQTLGPADFLFAMADVILTDRQEISLSPRPQLVSLHEYQELEHMSQKGTWLHCRDFEDKYVSPRLRLQSWTLRNYGI